MKKHNLHAFIKALNIFHSDLNEMKKFPHDKRMTNQEKNILQAWLWLKEGKTQLIIDQLLTVVSENDLVESQRLLILGLSYNNQTQFKRAIKYLESSIVTLKEYQLHNNLFTAYYNLFIAYLNSKNLIGMKKSLKELSRFSLSDDIRKILYTQCQFNLHSFQAEIKEAQECLNILNAFVPQMNEAIHVVHLISSFYFNVKIQEYNKCRQILGDLKIKRSFSSGANFKYMKFLFCHLVDNAPIYAYERDFKDFPYLFHQIMVIQYLESTQKEEALKYWEVLQHSYPESYDNNFCYNGEVTLFSLCLDRFNLQNTKAPISLNNLSKEEALLFVLQHQSSWIGKDELYEFVWGKPCEDKLEMNRLQKYITKLRNNGHDIQYKKGAYFLNQVEMKKSS